jgi:peroxiredoxin
MTLRERLQARLADAVRTRPPEISAAYAAGIEQVRAAGVAERALSVGASAPMFTLPDATGRPVALGDLLGTGPVIVTFYRGGWCPYCNLELRAYQDLLPEVAAAGVGLIAISPETPEVSLASTEQAALTFTVLSDVGNTVADAFGIVHAVAPEVGAIYARNGIGLAHRTAQDEDDLSLPLPATFVVDQQGTIRFAFVSADYTERAEPAEVIAVARTLTGA